MSHSGGIANGQGSVDLSNTILAANAGALRLLSTAV
jgi:hypothetical protein